MYQVTPYDVKQSFKLVPKNERYKITFAHGSSISFNSKREAFNFISAISNFFSEILQVSEMIHAMQKVITEKKISHFLISKKITNGNNYKKSYKNNNNSN